MLHQEHAGVSEVVGAQELATRCSGAPDRHRRRIRQFALVEAPDQRRRHVTVVGVVVVAAAVQIRRHRRNKVGAVLLAIGLAQLDRGDLGNRVPFIGRLQRTGQQRLLGYRLRRQLRIDAGGTEREQLLDAGLERSANDVEADRQIVSNEVRRKSIVGVNTADMTGGDDDRIRLIALQPRLGGRLLGEVELGPCRGENFAIFAAQPPNDGRPGQPVMPGHIDPLAFEIE